MVPHESSLFSVAGSTCRSLCAYNIVVLLFKNAMPNYEDAWMKQEGIKPQA